MNPSALAVHHVHGIRIRSPLALAAPVVSGTNGSGECSYDVDLRLSPPAPVPARPPDGDRIIAGSPAGDGFRYVAVGDGPRTVLRVPGVCDFVIGPGDGCVECRPDPSADLGLISILVTGLLVSYLLMVGGDCVLHASAVEVDGGAVAFLGSSGMGKSTLAA